MITTEETELFVAAIRYEKANRDLLYADYLNIAELAEKFTEAENRLLEAARKIK